MSRDETAWQDGETQFSAGAADPVAEVAREVPALTILAHRDSQRVGERLALPALTTGLEVRLSRLEPVFTAPGQRDPRPLEERYLSRQPVLFSGGEEPGSVAVDTRGTRTQVAADGQPIDGRRVFSSTELERGVVLLVGGRVVLLLHRMAPQPPDEVPDFGLVGESAGVVRLRQEIHRLAPLEVPVLLRGETGTGKELVARALHEAGPRRDRPYVTVNMGAVPPSLAAAELFGAARGAYTGADKGKAGFFRKAEGGTLFLDEIGETPPEVQVMLLRALESHEIQSVGSADAHKVDVRVIAATDAGLEEAMAAGRFRAPLYHRLAGYAVRLPSLAERRDDIGRLLYFFLGQELASLGESARLAGGEAWPPAEIVARLARYDWPGNVRELRNVARRLAIAGREATKSVLAAQIEELLAAPAAPTPAPAAPESTRQGAAPAPPPIPRRRRLRKPSEVSEEELLAALEAHSYKLQATAEALGLSRINLYRLIDETPAVRKAADLGREEIEDALERSGGDLDAAAAALKVSLQGLKRRMSALGLAAR